MEQQQTTIPFLNMPAKHILWAVIPRVFAEYLNRKQGLAGIFSHKRNTARLMQKVFQVYTGQLTAQLSDSQPAGTITLQTQHYYDLALVRILQKFLEHSKPTAASKQDETTMSRIKRAGSLQQKFKVNTSGDLIPDLVKVIADFLEKQGQEGLTTQLINQSLHQSIDVVTAALQIIQEQYTATRLTANIIYQIDYAMRLTGLLMQQGEQRSPDKHLSEQIETMINLSLFLNVRAANLTKPQQTYYQAIRSEIQTTLQPTQTSSQTSPNSPIRQQYQTILLAYSKHLFGGFWLDDNFEPMLNQLQTALQQATNLSTKATQTPSASNLDQTFISYTANPTENQYVPFVNLLLEKKPWCLFTLKYFFQYGAHKNGYSGEVEIKDHRIQLESSVRTTLHVEGQNSSLPTNNEQPQEHNVELVIADFFQWPDEDNKSWNEPGYDPTAHYSQQPVLLSIEHVHMLLKIAAHTTAERPIVLHFEQPGPIQQLKWLMALGKELQTNSSLTQLIAKGFDSKLSDIDQQQLTNIMINVLCQFQQTYQTPLATDQLTAVLFHLLQMHLILTKQPEKLVLLDEYLTAREMHVTQFKQALPNNFEPGTPIAITNIAAGEQKTQQVSASLLTTMTGSTFNSNNRADNPAAESQTEYRPGAATR